MEPTKPTMAPCVACKMFCTPMASGRCVACEYVALHLPVPDDPLHGGTVVAPGRKDDADKPDWSLLPFAAVGQVVRALDYGARRYGVDNWQQVPNARRRYFAALCRHAVRWFSGERYDKDSGLHHLAHAACCVLFLLNLDTDGKFGP